MGIEQKVTSLQNLVMQVEEAKSALKLLEQQVEEGVICSSQELERLVDERTAQYRDNAIVATMVRDFKARLCRS